MTTVHEAKDPCRCGHERHIGHCRENINVMCTRNDDPIWCDCPEGARWWQRLGRAMRNGLEWIGIVWEVKR
jgi:predicted nucleic acid binding AN1-type Zn finger protein